MYVYAKVSDISFLLMYSVLSLVYKKIRPLELLYTFNWYENKPEYVISQSYMSMTQGHLVAPIGSPRVDVLVIIVPVTKNYLS